MRPNLIWLTLPLLAGAVPLMPRHSPPSANVVIMGTVTNPQGQPIASARVTVDRTSFGTITDARGQYEFKATLGVGTEALLRVQMIGFTSAERSVRIERDTIRVDFVLQNTIVTLDALVITGERNPLVPRDQVSSRALGSGEVPTNALAMVNVQPMAPGHSVRGSAERREGWNTESYDLIKENEFRSATSDPLSTFSIDVDRASYGNVRRFLRMGQLPPKDAVRTEELVNYFPYDRAVPKGDAPFGVTTELAAAPWQPRHRLLRITLSAPAVDMAALPPSNLVFLIDVSGSMQSPAKLPLVKQSLRLLVETLREQDRVALVVYAGRAGLVLPSTAGSDKARIMAAIDALEAGGSTAGGAGLSLAYDVARKNLLHDGNNRVVLATDGDFNVGVSSDAEMVRLIEEQRSHGVQLTVLGFGMGNLKDSKLEKLADHGNGNYAYIDDLLEARKVLVKEAGGTLVTVASDVKIQVEFNPGRVRAYRLIGYENRLLAASEFDDDKKDAGEIGAGHTVTALYEVIPAGVTGTVVVAEPQPLRYQDVTRKSNAELGYVKLRYKLPRDSASVLVAQEIADKTSEPGSDMRFAAAVASFGMLLRQSEHCSGCTFAGVMTMAEGALGRDDDGYRRDFIELARMAGTIAERVATIPR